MRVHRKVSGSASLLTVVVETKHYRFLTGREHVKTYAAPILYSPPAYQSYFCSTCGSQVPPPSPPGESLEIAAGLFDDDFGIRPDKHIFIDFMPPWDDLHQQLPAYTLKQIYELRRGMTLPDDFVPRRHAQR